MYIHTVYRAMEFIQEFMSDVAGGEHSLDIAAGKAYTKSLRRYHSWIVRGIFSVSVASNLYQFQECTDGANLAI